MLNVLSETHLRPTLLHQALLCSASSGFQHQIVQQCRDAFGEQHEFSLKQAAKSITAKLPSIFSLIFPGNN